MLLVPIKSEIVKRTFQFFTALYIILYITPWLRHQNLQNKLNKKKNDWIVPLTHWWPRDPAGIMVEKSACSLYFYVAPQYFSPESTHSDYWKIQNLVFFFFGNTIFLAILTGTIFELVLRKPFKSFRLKKLF